MLLISDYTKDNKRSKWKRELKFSWLQVDEAD